MSEYIEKETAILNITERMKITDLEGDPYPKQVVEMMFRSLIESIPAADVRPVVRGKQTNRADRIRSMNDEELAWFLYEKGDEFSAQRWSAEVWLKWLEEETNE